MNVFPKVNFLALLLLLLSVAACENAEKPTLTEATYESILYEIELVHALHTQLMDTVFTESLLDSVWQKYGTTKDEFLKNHELYERDVQGQVRRVGRISERLGLELQDLEQKQYQLREDERLRLRREAGIE